MMDHVFWATEPGLIDLEKHVPCIYICGSDSEIQDNPENVVLMEQLYWGQGQVPGRFLSWKLVKGPSHELRLRR